MCVVCNVCVTTATLFSDVSFSQSLLLSLCRSSIRATHTMKFSAEQKQRILSQYSPHSRDYSYRALSRRYNLSPDGRTIKKWRQQWDGTVSSLRGRRRPGRPRILTPTQVHNHIHQPIVAANRRHECINYATIHHRVTDSLQVNVSRSTIRRYGYNSIGIRQRRVVRRSPVECNYDTHEFTITLSLYCLCVTVVTCACICVDTEKYRNNTAKR